MKSKKDWFDSHLIIEGDGLSEADKKFIKASIKKKCALKLWELTPDKFTNNNNETKGTV